MITPTYTECTQTEVPQPVVSETATCDYCITEEELERMATDPTPYTVSCASTDPKEFYGDYDYEIIEEDIEEKEHFRFLSMFHATAARLWTGFKRVIYWKRIRSRLFKACQPSIEPIGLVIVVVVIIPLV